MRIDELVVGPLATNCYVLSCEETGEAIILDPGAEEDKIKQLVTELSLQPVTLVLTHGHSDHMAAAAVLKREYAIPLALHGDDIETMKRSVADAPLWGLGTVEYPEVDVLLAAGDSIDFGKISGRVLHTPGHTRGGISLLFERVVFSGDTLFALSIGRTDFFGGDMDTLLRSIRRELFTLPGETIVYCGHGPSTSIATEKDQNPFLNGYF
ncbi:MAG: MBL fold metallo-hydrolase [Candidatus Krumholzibacteriota bacterium]|nr:MBL fold metallo-hydrolase [Candidatus Krumholzibacteriota bacterium]